mmetsp:Transcript_17977/g.58814  ORF Transcript_17977/g.58814 Transcript_17977/m.58814 type:complete len:479 (-) Transcript_17977:209-1645(-)
MSPPAFTIHAQPHTQSPAARTLLPLPAYIARAATRSMRRSSEEPHATHARTLRVVIHQQPTGDYVLASRAAPTPASQAPPFVRHHGWWIGDLRTTEASSPALTLEHTCPLPPALATMPRNLHAAASVVHSTRVPRSLLLLNMAEAASVAPGAPTAEKVETLWRPTGRACSPLIVPEATASAAGARAVLEVLADGGRRHLARRAFVRELAERSALAPTIEEVLAHIAARGSVRRHRRVPLAVTAAAESAAEPAAVATAAVTTRPAARPAVRGERKPSAKAAVTTTKAAAAKPRATKAAKATASCAAYVVAKFTRGPAVAHAVREVLADLDLSGVAGVPHVRKPATRAAVAQSVLEIPADLSAAAKAAAAPAAHPWAAVAWAAVAGTAVAAGPKAGRRRHDWRWRGLRAHSSRAAALLGLIPRCVLAGGILLMRGRRLAGSQCGRIGCCTGGSRLGARAGCRCVLLRRCRRLRATLCRSR